MSDDKRAFVALDDFRGIAAITVVAWHSSGFFGGGWPSEAYLAVDFFFTLSGFVLAYAYGERLRNGMPARQFMLLRLIRLYPLYILGFALWLPLGVSGYFVGNVSARALAITSATSITFLPTLFPGVLYPANLPAWSLFFELIANAWLGLFGAGRGNIALLVVAAIATVTATIATGAGLSGGYEWSSFYVGLIRVGYSFTAGVLVYRLWQERKPPVQLPTLVLGSALLAILTAKLPSAFEGLFAASASLVGFPVMIWFGASCRPGPFIAKQCAWLGAISYAIYAIHVPLLTLVLRAAAKTPNVGIDLPRWLYGIACIGVVIIAAHFADRLDGPVRRYLTSRLVRSAPSARMRISSI
jgi:peptidoglycan/LPS O-acetylase OafA/YrhL